MDVFRRLRGIQASEPTASPATSHDRPAALSPEESAFWQREFADLDELPQDEEATGSHGPLLTDADIARITREVEREDDARKGV
jgi:hypothetical protein